MRARMLVPSLVLHAVVFAALLVGVSCNKNQRAKSIHATLVAVDAARDGFVAWDREHQQALVDKATSREEGVAALEQYRGRRQVVVDGFEVTYRALAVAATQTDEPSLKAALEQAAQLLLTITQLRGGT